MTTPPDTASIAPPLQSPAEPVPTDTTAAARDSAARADTAALADALDENEMQSSIDSLYDTVTAMFDTMWWDTNHINSGRFESATWTDTAVIVLVDSAQGRAYYHSCPGYVTSNFGQRRYLWHYGVDVKLYKGDTVRAALPGVVRVIQYDRRGYGNVVVVRHHSGLETIYGHLSRKMVTPLDTVAAGDPIGLGGNTGRSTGSHLHFEIRYKGEPFDPNYIVDFDSCRLKSDTLVLTRANFEYLVELRKQKWCSIRPGDTLGHIAMRYHTSVNKLCQLNGISGRTLLRIGRKLRYQ